MVDACRSSAAVPCALVDLPRRYWGALETGSPGRRGDDVHGPYEGLHTGFRFAYDSEDWFLAKALANLLTFVVASVVTTFIWAVLRERRLAGRDAVNRRAGGASKQ